MMLDDVLAMLRCACAEAGTQQAWADAHGLSGGYVSDVLQGRREPGKGILDALGLERVVTYERRNAHER